MNKKFLSAVLFGSLFAASTGTFVSCKDYDDDISGLSEDINGLEDRVAAVEKLVNELQTKIQNGAVITDVKSNADGIVVTLSDGKSYTITNGKNGADGKPGAQGAQGEKGDKTIVEIGENGNWFIDGVDTGKPSRGEKGETGETGKPGEDGKPGEAGKPGEGAAAATSIYYRPGVEGAEKGKWVEVTVNAKGEKKETVTEMSWMPAGCENNLTAIWADDELTFTGVEGVEDGKLTVALKNVLKAMVFQPDFVMDGERAMEYLYFPYREHTKGAELKGEMKVHDIISDSESDNHDTVERTLGYTVEFSHKVSEDWSFLNPAQIKKYHMDPATAIIPSWWAANQEFEVASDDLDFIHKRSAAANPTAAYFNKIEDGIMEVNLQMLGQKVMNQARTLNGEPGTDYWARITNNKEKITQLAIQAPIKEDKSEMITSTYAAVYASQVGMEAIVYEKDNVNIIRTAEYGCEDLVGSVDHKDPAGEGYHLYATVKEAAEHAPTVELAYNSKTGINLNELVSTHVMANSERSWNADHIFWDMNDDKLAEYDMHFEFEQVGFAVGSNGTEESQNHCVLQDREDGKYIVACGVDSQSDTDQSKVQPDMDKIASSMASVGRTPLIMVKVVNEAGKVMKVGYIKFKIVAPEMPQVTEDFVLGNFYYGCDASKQIITWHAIEEKLLDVAEIHNGQAGTSKATFDALYEVVQNGDGVVQFVEDGVDKNGQKKFKNVTPVGVIKELANAGAETTDVFSWEFDRVDFVTMYNANKASYPEISLKRFVKYVAKGNLGNTGFNRKPIYLPINVKFCYPMGIMNNKIAKYWYADNTLTPAQSANDAMDAIHIGVEVPQVITESVHAYNDFYTDLDSRFLNNGMGGHILSDQPFWNPAYSYTENAPSAKFDINAFGKEYAWNKIDNFADFVQKDLTYFYYFTAKNNGRKVKGASGKEYTLSVASTAEINPVSLYPEAVSNTVLKNVFLKANGEIIAAVDSQNANDDPEMGSKHMYKFYIYNNLVAQDLINLPEGRKDLTADQVKDFMIKTLDVEIGVAAFNKCQEYFPLANNTFKAEIMKPVYMVPGKDVEFWDARDGEEEGTYVNLADLVSFYDWRERDFYPNHLNYYRYYGVDDIAIDVREIKTNLTGEMKRLGDTSLDVEFHVVRGGKTYDRELPPTAGLVSKNATWEKIVKHFGKLTYTYNNSTVGDFDIEIPVIVRHDWSEGPVYESGKYVNYTEKVIWIKGKVHHSEKN